MGEAMNEMEAAKKEAYKDADVPDEGNYFEKGFEAGYKASGQRSDLSAEVARLTNLCATLRREAEMHAQEARTANSTIYEIYEVVTGKTGEPGNWNGANPVREAFAQFISVLKLAKIALEGNNTQRTKAEAHKAICEVLNSPVAHTALEGGNTDGNT